MRTIENFEIMQNVCDSTRTMMAVLQKRSVHKRKDFKELSP